MVVESCPIATYGQLSALNAIAIQANRESRIDEAKVSGKRASVVFGIDSDSWKNVSEGADAYQTKRNRTLNVAHRERYRNKFCDDVIL
ncbi:hypothetical protein GCM10023156_15450 [Novipirellula rosea]|uniref:Uncharacterized protein n=1 Tax=Novipirellula rosea TaxID=1031540 RepID=A0ABP8MFT3_9BACT